MRVSSRRVAVGAALALAAAQVVIFAPGRAFAADVSSWTELQTAFSTTTSGTITLTADITGTPGQNLGLPGGADVTLDLNGRTLDIDASSGGGLAGINVVPGVSLTITDTSASGTGHLIARGGLTTISNGGAGIGGSASQPGGSVTVEAGTVDAYGGYQAAGIGGADFSGGSFTMTGGTVNAVGGYTAAGIGGGWSGGGGTVTISGGTLTASGGANAAGIGAGVNGPGAAVSISGGTVTAISGGVAAAVGGSNGNNGGTLDVYATPFGDPGTGGGLAVSAPPVTPHVTGGLRYAVATSGGLFQLQFGQVLSFDSTGGSSVPDEFAAQGSAPAEPTPPTLADHVFLGWYTTSDLSTPFDFTAALTADSTAFAMWANSQNAVSFDLGGHGAPIPDQSVDYGSPASEPTAPSAVGYTFGGWYADAALTTPYSFATPVTAPITVYATWTANLYTVTFDPADGGAVTTVAVEYGVAVAAPASPSRSGYTFTGWYSDPAATTAYDFALPVTGALSLFAGWEALAAQSSDSPSTAPSSQLASTGFGSATWLGIAVLLLLSGATAVLCARRRRSQL